MHPAFEVTIALTGRVSHHGVRRGRKRRAQGEGMTAVAMFMTLSLRQDKRGQSMGGMCAFQQSSPEELPGLAL